MNSIQSAPISRFLPLDYLRGFVTLLVVTHHAVLAYHTYSPPLGTFDRTLVWGAFPIVDPAKAKGVELLVGWNDSYFMGLMFFISGLFVWRSLERKGAVRFVRDRAIRLGGAFVGSALVLAPLGYLPAYLQRSSLTPGSSFWSAWISLGVWPAGPAWFLWVLLGFGCLAAIVFAVSRAAMNRLSHRMARLTRRPVLLALVFGGFAIAAYWPITLVVNPFQWASWGPFIVQKSRVALYAVYFAFGVTLGAKQIQMESFLAPDAALARRRWLWQFAALSAFGGMITAFVIAVTQPQNPHLRAWATTATILFIASGVLTSFMWLGFFARWRKPNAMAETLSRNSFRIYLVHYPFVTWLQFALLPAPWTGWTKAIVVTIGAVSLSWLLAVASRATWNSLRSIERTRSHRFTTSVG